MKRTIDWQKWVAISTIILAFAAVAAAGLAAIGTAETRRMVELTREALEANRQTAEINDEMLQANLLVQRYQLLKEHNDEHRTSYYMAFQEYLYFLSEETAGAASGFQLVNNEDLCSTLGPCGWVCTQFHEYDRARDRTKGVPFDIVRSLQARDFEAAAEDLDTLEANLREMNRLYREVFFPGRAQDR